MTKDQWLAVLEPLGQSHVMAHWDALDDGQRGALAAQLDAIDLDLVARLFADRDRQGNFRELADRALPPPAFRLDPTQNPFTVDEAIARGRAALDAGQVGAMLVAGGQGTRLGFDHPKGMFAIGPVSGRTLFQIHVEKLLAVGRRHGVRIPLYLMTSPATHEETVAYFAEHGRFGLLAEDLHIFCQGTMPAVDAQTGKLLLESPGRLATSPDGHGGMLAAFAASGAMADAKGRGIRQLFYFQVDNPLIDVCGAEYLGYHLLAEAEMTTQVVAKRDPTEKVGNVVRVDDRLLVIEYSDLPDDAAARRNADGSLAIWAGSIAVHIFDLDFLEKTAGAADALPFHFAKKKVPYLDDAGRRIEPTSPNAIKFERFIFDLMPSARKAVVIEVDPDLAFAPLKNASGAATDSPEWVQRQMIALGRVWLRQAGAVVADDTPVEISPFFALDADELKQKLKPGLTIASPTFLQ